VSAGRVGIGFDVHPFVDGRPLVLGGVVVPHPKGLDGHSDADVVCHAVADSLLGALALGDIGVHFPSGDPKWKGASSLDLLSRVFQMIAAQGYEPANVDVTVVAQEPTISPFVGDMRSKIAGALSVPRESVSVKATSTDRLGFCGRGEGIAALAVSLLQPARGSAARPLA
jgi:2-C-methyl-D-erythritol 2,4-cyclodiphosphate synthase